MTIQDLKNGLVVAVKGLGGFHLLVDAFNEEAVRRLRHQKSRQEKPFALLFPSLASIREHCHVGLLEETLLTGAESPIVLLRKKETSPLPEILAPGNPMLGCMLPYTPLHVLLMEKMGSPVVATSGNLSDEPICIDNEEALEKLSPFVNRFLVHDRPIVRHVDDSIARVTPSAVVLLRRARGYAPLPLQTRKVLPPLLALGSDLKNAIGISRGNEIILSQHIGDLESRESFDAFRRVIDDFRKIFDFRPEAVVTDLHPSFFSTQFAAELGLPHIQVQHHFAHLAAALLDHGLEDQDEDVLGVIWDGTGFGLDGTIWGGEFLVGNASHFRRFAHLRTFPLVGGDQAAQEPRRSALGVLAEIFGADRLPSGALPLKAYSEMELRFLKSVLGKVYSDQRAEFHKGFQRDPCTGPKSFGAISSFAIHTSSAGRLFDAVASFLGLHQKSSFEGQAGMALEFAAMKFDGGAAPLSAPYSFRLQRISEHPDSKPGEQSPFKNGPIVVDWEPMIREILQEIEWNCREGSLEAMPRFALVSIAHRFHETLAEMILEVAKKADLPQIVLSGGVFQNVHLLSRAREKLQAAGFKVISNQRIPPNDGGIAAGQLVAAPHSRDAQANFSSCNEVPSCH